MTAATIVRRTSPRIGSRVPAIWSLADTGFAVGWFVLALIARAPLVARIESVLDHDQSIVGLMALDIAAGRRFPIFFDGQRYMGALEPYVAALMVACFGHSPRTVALAPWLFCGLFVAGQYALWRCWSDRATAHLAALVSIIGAPMLVLWSIVPRGGYIELLAWALPVLAIYRAWTCPGVSTPSPIKQGAWGFLFALGYFLNPLSLIVYLTLALDWTFGRHGLALRVDRRATLKGWIDSKFAPLVWAIVGMSLVGIMAIACHVEVLELHRDGGKSVFVFLLDAVPRPWNLIVGTAGVVGVLGGSLWWTGLGGRVVRGLAEHTSFALGAMLALTPFLANAVCVRLGVFPQGQSLPIWIRNPLDLGVNIHDGIQSLGTLIGCASEGTDSVLLGQGIEPPVHAWPGIARTLTWYSWFEVALAAVLIATVAWRDRSDWRRFWSLRGEDRTPPTLLSLLLLSVATLLYLLQATSLNASSVRYLVPTWIVLPGLLASAVCHLRSSKQIRWAVCLALVVPWGIAQLNLWADMSRSSPLRPLAEAPGATGCHGNRGRDAGRADGGEPVARTRRCAGI